MGIELEITEGFLFDTNVDNGKLIFASQFNIEKKNFTFEYEGVSIDLECDNN
jgi:hypothetical protein